MQFGGGKFLRAFADWMIEELNQKAEFNGGILVVKPTDGGDYNDLRKQDGRFHVLLNDWDGTNIVTSVNEVNCIQEVVNPYKEWDLFLNYAKEESLRFVISNTTEAGIKFSREDDFQDVPPITYPAKLTKMLYHRFQYFGNDASKGLIMLPCELINNNGEALKNCVLEYAAAWKLEGEFIRWIVSHNKFYNTMVDRIVSGYPDTITPTIKNKITFDDKLLVSGEYYHSWVIQAGHELAGEFPVDKADLNVSFVEDIVPYHDMKVRILNGSHTAMVFVGILLDIEYVHEFVESSELKCFLDSMVRDEVLSTINIPFEVKDKFYNGTLTRFKNPSLQHKLADIALNSSHKYVSRLWPTIQSYIAHNQKTPVRLAFITACMILFFKGEYKERVITLNDDKQRLNDFSDLWSLHLKGILSRYDLVNEILFRAGIPKEDLNKELIDEIVFYLNEIEEKDVLRALVQIVSKCY